MGKKVLIVDNSFGDRLVMKDLLMSAGWSVAGEARTFEEGLEKYKALQPDLVLMSAAVPAVDGVSAVMHLLREDHEAKVLICATRGQRVLALEAVQAGAKDFITKPISPRTLRKVLQGVA